MALAGVCIGLASAGLAEESTDLRALGIASAALPTTVTGVKRQGNKILTVKVSVKTADGQVTAGAVPEIAVVQSPRWSPNDAQREGASEVEILLCAARMITTHPLSGIVGVGNNRGMFIPAANDALHMTACMGIPVVRVGRSTAAREQNNLFIEGGALSTDDARRLLTVCLLRFGAPPPAANPAHPTAAESSAIQQKLQSYQTVFDTQGAVRVAATEAVSHLGS